MKLNLDCVRAVLFTTEKMQLMQDNNIVDVMEENTYFEALGKDFSHADIAYTLKQLIANGMLIGRTIEYSSSADFLVEDISPQGHEFLNNIRNEENWGKVKNIANKAGAYGLSIIEKIAVGVTTAYLKTLMEGV